MGIGGDDGRSGAGGERRGLIDDGGEVQGRRTPTPWADIAARPSFRRTGRHHLRLVTVAAAVTVAAVTVAAVTVGGHVGLTSKDTVSSSDRKQPGDLHGASSRSTSPHGLLATGAPGGAAGSISSGGIVACPMTPGVADMTGGNQSLGSATHLFIRTTADGVTIRAYRLSSTLPCACGPIPYDSPTPASSGSSSGPGASGPLVVPGGSSTTPATSLEFSDDTAVGQGVLFGALGVSAPTNGPVAEPPAVISNAFGVPEGAPVWWIAASVGPEVASAQMTFVDGSTDEMSPIDGVVVLAHQIDDSVAASGEGPYEVRGTLQLLDSSGAVINTVPFPTQDLPPAPLPVPDPSTPPAPVAGSTASTASTAVPALTSPLAPNGSMIVCPETMTPTEASAG
jgi:hypothetical protein